MSHVTAPSVSVKVELLPDISTKLIPSTDTNNEKTKSGAIPSSNSRTIEYPEFTLSTSITRLKKSLEIDSSSRIVIFIIASKVLI